MQKPKKKVFFNSKLDTREKVRAANWGYNMAIIQMEKWIEWVIEKELNFCTDCVIAGEISGEQGLFYFRALQELKKKITV